MDKQTKWSRWTYTLIYAFNTPWKKLCKPQYVNYEFQRLAAGNGHIWFAYVPFPLSRLVYLWTLWKWPPDRVMKDLLSITGLAASMTGSAFSDVTQSICSTMQANTGAGDNPEENISLGPLVDALLVYLNKGQLKLWGKSGMSLPLTTLNLHSLHFCLSIPKFLKGRYKKKCYYTNSIVYFFIYR